MQCMVCQVFLFAFKQSTAYEMRISYWSSDVFSSDLGSRHPQGPLRPPSDPADELSRPLAIGSAAVANHERPRHDSPIHVIRHGLPAAVHHSDQDRKSVVSGNSVSLRVEPGG